MTLIGAAATVLLATGVLAAHGVGAWCYSRAISARTTQHVATLLAAGTVWLMVVWTVLLYLVTRGGAR